MSETSLNPVNQLINIVEATHQLSNPFKADLRKLFREVRIKKNSNILNCREHFGHLIFLLHGSAMEVSCHERSFAETTVWFWNEKEFICATEDNSSKISQSNVVALEDSTFLILDEKDLNALILKFPEAEQALQLFQNKHNLRVAEHLRDYSRLTAQRKFNKFNEDFKHIAKVAMRKTILEFLNIKTDTLSRYTQKK